MNDKEAQFFGRDFKSHRDIEKAFEVFNKTGVTETIVESLFDHSLTQNPKATNGIVIYTLNNVTGDIFKFSDSWEKTCFTTLYSLGLAPQVTGKTTNGELIFDDSPKTRATQAGLIGITTAVVLAGIALSKSGSQVIR